MTLTTIVGSIHIPFLFFVFLLSQVHAEHLFLFLIHKASLAELQLGEEYDKLGQRTSQSGRNTYKRISSKIAGGRRPGAKAGEEYVTSSIRHDSQCRGRESYDVRLIDGCPARLLEVSDHSRICSAEFCPEEAFITVTPVGLQVQLCESSCP
ncbi:hypothetical protein J6590_103208 [Homalodisca vitripennis]|nr:hypothetical protein J6590_103208 [Homalodisca vitripennis]